MSSWDLRHRKRRQSPCMARRFWKSGPLTCNTTDIARTRLFLNSLNCRLGCLGVARVVNAWEWCKIQDLPATFSSDDLGRQDSPWTCCKVSTEIAAVDLAQFCPHLLWQMQLPVAANCQILSLTSVALWAWQASWDFQKHSYLQGGNSCAIWTMVWQNR